jgi:hypothetical protein
MSLASRTVNLVIPSLQIRLMMTLKRDIMNRQRKLRLAAVLVLAVLVLECAAFLRPVRQGTHHCRPQSVIELDHSPLQWLMAAKKLTLYCGGAFAWKPALMARWLWRK